VTKNREYVVNKSVQVLITLLIGLIIGAVCTSFAMRTLSKSTAYPKGVMAVEGAHAGALNKLQAENRCTTAEIQPHLITMRIVASDIEPAFKSRSEKDVQFVRYAGDLRRALDFQLAKSINNCPDLLTGLGEIKRACDNCHRDYK
jgi:hypothetical protein